LRPTSARTRNSSGSSCSRRSRSSWCRRGCRRRRPAFYTPTGYGTLAAAGKETREFDGRHYVLERALHADFAFVKAWKGDTVGNLVYRRTARNFNPVMATAAALTIAEVEQLVAPGEIDPHLVHTPGIYVRHILQGRDYVKAIEKRTVRHG
jgi:3-oxoacid CoA-transferase subunit A